MLSEKPWKLEGLMRLLMCLLISIASFAFAAIAAMQITHAKLEDNTPLLTVLNTLALDGSMLIAIFIFLRTEKLSWSEAFGFRNRTWHALMWGIIAAVCFTPIGQGMNELCARALESFHLHPQTEQAVETLRKATPGFSRVFLVVFAVVIAPVAEEGLFRGVIYASLKQYGFPRAALWGSSILFAAIHGNLPAFLPLTVFAIILAVMYEKTNNLLACIVAHSMFNATGVYLLYHYSSPATQQPY